MVVEDFGVVVDDTAVAVAGNVVDGSVVAAAVAADSDLSLCLYLSILLLHLFLVI